jgi:hypothetical protein
MASRRKSFADAMEGFSQSFLPIWSQLQYAQRWGDENRRRRRSDAMAEVDTALGRLDAKNAPQSAYDDLRDRMGSGEWADLIVPLGERITAAFPTLRERATAAGTDLGAGLRTAGGPQLTGALLNAGATPTYHDFSGPVQQDPEAQRRELEQMPEAIRGATGVSDAAMEEMLGQQDTYRRGLVEGEAQRRRDYLASGGTNHPQYHVEPITHGPHAGGHHLWQSIYVPGFGTTPGHQKQVYMGVVDPGSVGPGIGAGSLFPGGEATAALTGQSPQEGQSWFSRLLNTEEAQEVAPDMGGGIPPELLAILDRRGSPDRPYGVPGVIAGSADWERRGYPDPPPWSPPPGETPPGDPYPVDPETGEAVLPPEDLREQYGLGQDPDITRYYEEGGRRPPSEITQLAQGFVPGVALEKKVHDLGAKDRPLYTTRDRGYRESRVQSPWVPQEWGSAGPLHEGTVAKMLRELGEVLRMPRGSEEETRHTHPPGTPSMMPQGTGVPMGPPGIMGQPASGGPQGRFLETPGAFGRPLTMVPNTSRGPQSSGGRFIPPIQERLPTPPTAPGGPTLGQPLAPPQQAPAGLRLPPTRSSHPIFGPLTPPPQMPGSGPSPHQPPFLPGTLFPEDQRLAGMNEADRLLYEEATTPTDRPAVGQVGPGMAAIDAVVPGAEEVDAVAADMGAMRRNYPAESSVEILSELEEYGDLIAGAAEEYDVPLALVQNLIMGESSGDPEAIGRETTAGWHALGLMQLALTTAQEQAEEIAVEANLRIDEVFDGIRCDRNGRCALTEEDLINRPDWNIILGTRYLGEKLNEWGNDPFLAVMAYNSGTGSLQDWITNNDKLDPATQYFKESRDLANRVTQNKANVKGVTS